MTSPVSRAAVILSLLRDKGVAVSPVRQASSEREKEGKGSEAYRSAVGIGRVKGWMWMG